MKILYTEDVNKEIKDKVSEEFDKYEKEKGIEFNYKKFAFVIKNELGKILGGLVGYTIHNEVYVDEIFVTKPLRGKGYGTKLLKAVENHFSGKGYDNINLFTNNFHAPEFYKKCGFELEFVRENRKNPKLHKYFFIKRFKN
jgi:GNAT superfamily N-acetyltransferase